MERNIIIKDANVMLNSMFLNYGIYRAWGWQRGRDPLILHKWKETYLPGIKEWIQDMYMLSIFVIQCSCSLPSLPAPPF